MIEADEAEQIAEGKQGEDQPDRMHADFVADELRRQNIGLEKLAGEHESHGHGEQLPMRPALDDRDDGRNHKSGERSDIGNEAQQPGRDADQKAEIQADQRKADAIPDTEKETDERLPAQKAGECIIDLMRELMRGLAMPQWNESIDRRDHLVPIEQQIKGDDRHHDQQ